MTGNLDIAPFRAAIVAAFPDLAGARFAFLPKGWHSSAVDVDDRLVFKFPRGSVAEAALVREAGLLAAVRPRLTMPVPALTLHHGPPLFSRHAKLRGTQLLTADYACLPDAARDRLAADLARFHAELHAIDRATMEAAGARPVEAWLPADGILAGALPALPNDLRSWAEALLAAYANLPPDPHGETYGFFDGHGWNMAFDRERKRLAGIYDFADSGFGPLHRDFVYASFISADLTRRMVDAYEGLTGRPLDRQRIAVLTGTHRLWELAVTAGDAASLPKMRKAVADWATGSHGIVALAGIDRTR